MSAQRNLIKATVMVIALGAALPAMANHYVYYGHDVYYAPQAKTYYWRDHGDWRSGATVGRGYSRYVRGNGFEIDLDTPRPYDRHDYVVERYRHSRRHHHDHHH